MPSNLSGLLISDFTIHVLKSFLEQSSETPVCHVETAPFGQTISFLKNPSEPSWQTQWDFIVVWTQVQAVIPSFAKVLRFEEVAHQDLINECDFFVNAIKEASSRGRFIFVTSWTLPEFYRGYGPIDLKKDNGLRHTLMIVNQRLIEGLADIPNIYILSTDRWLQTIGEKACDPRLWYLSKVPFDPAIFKMAAIDIKASLNAALGVSRKLIILDLDNTLWGGIVGDDGWESLHIGGHDPQGEAFVDFQRALKAYKERGLVLAIASKNDEARALEAMRCHPEMVLKERDFVCLKINWEDKAKNIEAILKELNLTQESAVFIDDNPRERDRIRQALPGVFVPEWPQNSLLYLKAFLSLSCFDTTHISDDDKKRTQMYSDEKERSQSRIQTGNLEDWLLSLNTTVTIEPLTQANLPRATQLLNKTNQMNLTTRRLSEEEFKAWSEQKDNRVWVFRVEDKLGDSGLTGIASLTCQGTRAHIVDFILSCRVFGRKVEDAMAHRLIEAAKEAGAKMIQAHYLPTEKNKPCLEFFIGRSGFVSEANHVFVWDTRQDYPAPYGIKIVTSQDSYVV